ncbi:hypothetical protein [Intrasporangium sp. DVR]|uniref:hypothetical protein n=1 Tax=Intrasporangium sp. DVR TaxID=3127867 RepID=UPI00313A6B9D
MTLPDQSEQQLRRALSTMNDLQPPTDELFVQRAVIRGRARTHRRRNALVGVAAAFVVVAGGGGTWLLQNGFPSGSLPSPASQAEAGAAQGEYGTQMDTSGGLETPRVAEGPETLPFARQADGWFIGPMTPERAAIEELAPELTTTWGATFSGAWATDRSNTALVVAVTRRDAALEQLVRGALPDPSAVDFVEVEHSYADKARLVERIWLDSPTLESEGIVISSVAQDYRADRVAVAASGDRAAARLSERYGAEWVSVTELPKGPGGTLPTPQR